MVRGGLAFFALALLLIVAPLADQGVLASAQDNVCSEYFRVDYPIAVIMVGFEDGEVDLVRSSLENGSYRFVELAEGCGFDLSYSFVVVSGSGDFGDTVRSYLEEAYTDRGVPWWVSEYVNATGVNVTVKWVELRGFYRFLYALASSYLESLGVWYRDILVLIGDIDGVSRQYWAEVPYEYVIGGRLVLEGVKGWSGPLPLTFYDLTVIPKPRPEKDMPLYWLGVHVNYTSEPPIWDLRSQGRLVDYIVGLVKDHVRYRVVSVAAPSVLNDTPLRVEYKIIVVSFGNESVVEEITSMMGVEEIVRLTKTLVPWVEVSVEVLIMAAREFVGLQEYVESLNPDDEGFINLEHSVVSKKLFNYVLRLNASKGFPVFNYVFFVLATSEPSRFVSREGFYFTGFSSGTWGATTWPGHGYRNYEGGLPRTIVHELGHSLGLAHSFAYFIGETKESGVRWLMDWASTVMSYEDAVIAGFLEEPGGGYVPDYYTVYREGLKYAGSIALYLAERGTISREAAINLLREAAMDPLGAALEAVLLYYKQASRTATTTTTVTETVPVTVTVIETSTTSITSTETLVTTITKTLVKATTREVTVTESLVETETITVEETRYSTTTKTLTTTIQVETIPWEPLAVIAVAAILAVLALAYLRPLRGS